MFGEQTFAQLRTGLSILTVLALLSACLGETLLLTKRRVIPGMEARHHGVAINEVSSIGTLSRNALASHTFVVVTAVAGVGIIPG